MEWPCVICDPGGCSLFCSKSSSSVLFSLTPFLYLAYMHFVQTRIGLCAWHISVWNSQAHSEFIKEPVLITAKSYLLLMLLLSLSSNLVFLVNYDFLISPALCRNEGHLVAQWNIANEDDKLKKLYCCAKQKIQWILKAFQGVEVKFEYMKLLQLRLG